MAELINRLLSALPAREYKRLQPHLKPVELEFKQVAFNANVPIEYVYFPENCVISVLGLMPDGSAIEVATVGREGMTGLPVFLGAGQMPAQAFTQVPGRALRMSAAVLREQSQRLEGLHRLLEHYTQALFTQISQGAACNRLHALEERCARWLLMTHDRVGSDSFPLTQQFLSQMLGVRRAGVSEAASVLQREGLLRYNRGQLTVLDRPGLEAATCECYGIIRSEFDRLLEGKKTRSPLSGVASRLVNGGQSVLKDGAPKPRRKPGSRR
jgi:CRP-like cAMP-binding protein